MPTSPSPEWARRHRLQHEAHLKGRKLPLQPQVSRRYASEFEAALRQRGADAKAAAAKRRAR